MCLKMIEYSLLYFETPDWSLIVICSIVGICCSTISLILPWRRSVMHLASSVVKLTDLLRLPMISKSMIKLPNLQIWKQIRKRFTNCGIDHFSFNLKIWWINYRSLNDEQFSLLTEQIKLSPSKIRLHFPLCRKHLTRKQYFNIIIKKIKKYETIFFSKTTIFIWN